MDISRMRKKIIITLVIGVVLLIGFYLITGAITKYTGYSVSDKKNDLEICLENKEITLYINSLDSAETLRGLKVDKHLDNIEIINCYFNKRFCLDRGVRDFPLFIIEGKRIKEDLDDFKIKKAAGCSSI